MQLENSLLGAVFGLLIAAASYAAKFLTRSGALATWLLAIVIFGFGGWAWTVPIVTFFLTSSILSKVGRTKKSQYDSLFEKTGARDWAQVAANGGIPGVLAFLAAAFPSELLYPIYLGSIAAATADTWGTEIGVLSKEQVYSLVAWKPVTRGTSGGVTLSGTLGGALGAMVVASSGYMWYQDHRTAMIIIASGLAGSLADSLLGATVQARFRCSVCGRETERATHCSKPTIHAGGIEWMKNDAVNVACSAIGALVASFVLIAG